VTGAGEAVVRKEPGTSAGKTALADYRALLRRRRLLVVALAVATVVAFAADLATGPSALRLQDLLHGLIAPAELSRANAVIIFDVRLPQAMIAVLVGASLSLAGAELQTILNNPMASPFTLGISSGATLGAALAIVFGLGIPGIPDSWLVSANAFVLAFAASLLLQALARTRGSADSSIVLFGIALFFAFNALIALTQFAASEQALQQLVFWTMGSLSRATPEKAGIVAIVLLLTLPFSLHAAWKLTALRLGQDRARSFGVNVVRLRLASLVRVSLLTATAVAFVGTIAFVGLVGPHIARLLVGEDHRYLLATSALAGAAVMALSSVASKSVIPGIIMPIGLITSLIGVPFFLALIYLRQVGR